LQYVASRCRFSQEFKDELAREVIETSKPASGQHVIIELKRAGVITDTYARSSQLAARRSVNTGRL
jgi:hypothetical protein